MQLRMHSTIYRRTSPTTLFFSQDKPKFVVAVKAFAASTGFPECGRPSMDTVAPGALVPSGSCISKHCLRSCALSSKGNFFRVLDGTVPLACYRNRAPSTTFVHAKFSPLTLHIRFLGTGSPCDLVNEADTSLFSEKDVQVLEQVAASLLQSKALLRRRLEDVLPQAALPLLQRFGEVREDIKTLRYLLKEQEELCRSKEGSECGEDVDEELQRLEQEQGSLEIEIGQTLLVHANTIRPALQAWSSDLSLVKAHSDFGTDETVLEVMAGVGGEEAALFASEIFSMYSALADSKGWSFVVFERQQTDTGGLRRGTAHISGSDAYKLLRHEAGVHRVQRVPTTDAKRRVQTSSAAVAVLPRVSEAEVDMSPSTLKIESMRASGPGGQSVNKSETAVRVTHLPTKTSVCMQDSSSQVENKQRALLILRHMLQKRQQQKVQQELSEQATSQIGTKDRSEKIRTYNFQSDFVRDHRCQFQCRGVRDFLGKAVGLPHLLETLQLIEDRCTLKQMLNALQRWLQEEQAKCFS